MKNLQRRTAGGILMMDNLTMKFSESERQAFRHDEPMKKLADIWGLSEEHIRNLIAGPKVNVAQAAEMLGVERRTIYNMICAGDFPAFRLNKALRIPEQSIVDYISRQMLKKALE